MQVNVEKLSPVLMEFQVEVPADRVRSEVDKAYTALQRTARVRGYRPGKAPRQVLAHLYGGRIHADVAQRLVDATLNQALADKQVQPLSQPAIAPTELRPDDTFSYKARFEVRPDIAEVKWEGFEVKRPSTTPTDEMIDAEITALRREHSTLQAPEPERPAAKGMSRRSRSPSTSAARCATRRRAGDRDRARQRPGLQGDRGRPRRDDARPVEGRPGHVLRAALQRGSAGQAGDLPHHAEGSAGAHLPGGGR